MDSSKLPIDIHCNKLLDWVLDRRLCQRDWQKNMIPIRDKINKAIQDMPEHDEIRDLLSGSMIHYFNCLKIIEILKETEKQSKNIFGMYSSQRMKDWNNIVSLYQKNSVYLAESTSLLQRSVSYEIPALKKQITRLQQLQNECEEKHQSLGRSINEITHQLKQAYEDLGIKGQNLVSELKALPSSLDPMFDQITTKCTNLSKIVTFYVNYNQYFNKKKAGDLLPHLSYLINNGNKTVYEWRTGCVPKSIEKAPLQYSFGEESESKTKIGDADDEINFDLDDVVLDEGGEIDWGDSEIVDVAAESNDVIEIDDNELKNLITVESTGVYIPTDGIAKGNDAFKLLELCDTRHLIFQDIVRLKAFLKQRYNEMCEGENVLTSTIMQDAPKDVQNVSEKEIKRYIDMLTEIITYYSSKKIEKLFLIIDSPKYLVRVYNQLIQKQKSIERCKSNQQNGKEKLKSLNQEEVNANEKLKQLIKKSKELQKYISEDLSKRYNNTRVNIMGELNTL